MKIYIFIVVIAVYTAIGFSQNVASNQQWIEDNLTGLLDSLNIKEMLSGKNYELELGAVKGEKTGFLQSVIYNSFKAGSAVKNKAEDFVLRIEQFETAIVYRQQSRGFLNLETNTYRENKIKLNGWIYTLENNQLLKAFNIHKNFREKLKSDNITILEEGPYMFARGETIETSVWTEFVEPGLIASSVAVIVYLFFSVRS